MTEELSELKAQIENLKQEIAGNLTAVQEDLTQVKKTLEEIGECIGFDEYKDARDEIDEMGF